MNLISARNQLNKRKEYPMWSMVAVLFFVLLSPFVSMHLNWIALVVCLVRMVAYDEKVFATDYCILMPLTQTFCTDGGMSLIVWLCLVAAIWYFVKGKIRANGALICIILLMNYLLLRMQMNMNDFVLCFGQMFVLYVLLPKQSTESAVRSAIAFCWSLTLTSLYALIFRNTNQIITLRGPETPAIWGLSYMRFYGLFRDPNYYTTFIIAGLALICKLKETNYVDAKTFWFNGVVLSLLGLLTCSKAFILVFVLLGGVYIVWQFWSRKALRGMAFALIVLIACAVLLLYEDSPLAIVLDRLTSAKDMDSLTTGRLSIYATYMKAITKNIGVFVFGYGLGASGLVEDPHNLYLEMMYYVGVAGFILIAAFYIAMIVAMQTKRPEIRTQGMISKYIVLLMVLVIYMSLQGLFIVMTYGTIYLAMMAVLIVPEKALPAVRPAQQN